MRSITRFSSRAISFQRKYPDLKWQHCCALAAFYTQQELEIEKAISPSQPGKRETNLFRAFLDEAIRLAETTEPLSIIQYTTNKAEIMEGGRDDGMVG